MSSNMESMKAKLEEKKKRKKESPTGSLLEPFDEKPESSDKFESLSKTKKKVEDTHTRKTFLVRNDLIERLNEVASERHHGFQTEFINIAIEYGLDRTEDV